MRGDNGLNTWLYVVAVGRKIEQQYYDDHPQEQDTKKSTASFDSSGRPWYPSLVNQVKDHASTPIIYPQVT